MLVRLYEEFNDDGVIFVGLTADDVTALNEIKAHLAQLKIPWPSGYGAADTMTAMGVASLPTRLLVNPHNQIVWRGADVESLRHALQQALGPIGKESDSSAR